MCCPKPSWFYTSLYCKPCVSISDSGSSQSESSSGEEEEEEEGKGSSSQAPSSSQAAPTPPKLLSETEMNRLGAKVLRAEMLGDEVRGRKTSILRDHLITSIFILILRDDLITSILGGAQC